MKKKSTQIFNGDKVLKDGSQCIFLSVILTDCVFRTGKIYYPQVLLEECKCVTKEKRCLNISLTT